MDRLKSYCCMFTDGKQFLFRGLMRTDTSYPESQTVSYRSSTNSGGFCRWIISSSKFGSEYQWYGEHFAIRYAVAQSVKMLLVSMNRTVRYSTQKNPLFAPSLSHLNPDLPSPLFQPILSDQFISVPRCSDWVTDCTIEVSNPGRGKRFFLFSETSRYARGPR